MSRKVQNLKYLTFNFNSKNLVNMGTEFYLHSTVKAESVMSSLNLQ